MTIIIASAIVSITFYVAVRIAAEMQAQARDAAEYAAEVADDEAHYAVWEHVAAGSVEERAFREFIASRS